MEGRNKGRQKEREEDKERNEDNGRKEHREEGRKEGRTYESLWPPLFTAVLRRDEFCICKTSDSQSSFMSMASSTLASAPRICEERSVTFMWCQWQFTAWKRSFGSLLVLAFEDLKLGTCADGSVRSSTACL